ncbi:hypothetical protein RhiirA5_434183 [Rhizophagus irregularis]|uniref:Uncharacterized protein n=1 Tax=Rhizophagus irregularis TaxID=588596 RepID=A0A2N0NQI8_9GLOM|nr:hypothetical protein RhiirA5_434183 [Rhizophagus irregularis]
MSNAYFCDKIFFGFIAKDHKHSKSWIDKKDLENNDLITKINQYEYKLLFRTTSLDDLIQ